LKVAVTGATGTIGRAVVHALLERGDSVVALSRDAASAREKLGAAVDVHEWRDPKGEPAPADAFADVEGVIHLLGEPVAQRWSDEAKDEIRDSRVLGTRNLVMGLRAAAGPRLKVLVAQSATGFYGPHGDEQVDESASAGSDFLAEVVVAWEAEARGAEELGLRAPICRTGVVLSEGEGALAKMLPPFKLGVGGPVASGRQYIPWIHLDDVVGALLFALDNDAADGPLNITAPDPATNKDFSKALGRTLGRPAVMPVPGFAIKLLYGEMASIVTTGVRAVPKRLLELGYRFRRAELDAALKASI
jgi:uncharacterized protein (TIGR01777 family)